MFDAYIIGLSTILSVDRALVILSVLLKVAWIADLIRSKIYFLNTQWGSGRYFFERYTNCITGEHFT